MKQSIEILKAERIFEEILNGDAVIYDNANFSDIIDSLEIGRNNDDYAIETHMNHCFLNVGYKWCEMKDGELQLKKEL